MLPDVALGPNLLPADACFFLRKNSIALIRKKTANRYYDWHLALSTSEFHSSIRGEWARLKDAPHILTYNTQNKMLYGVRKSQFPTLGCSVLGKWASPKGAGTFEMYPNINEGG